MIIRTNYIEKFSIWKWLNKKSYVDNSVQEEEEACGIAVLSGGYHDIDVAMLNEHVGHAVVEHDRILRLRIGLRWKGEELESEDSRCESEWKRREVKRKEPVSRWAWWRSVRRRGRRRRLGNLARWGRGLWCRGGTEQRLPLPLLAAAVIGSWIPIRSAPPSKEKGEEEHEKQGLLYDAVTTK